MDPKLWSLLWLDRVVAASVSEWRSCHSLTLAATPETKKTREIWHRDGLIKYPGACPGDLYCTDGRRGSVVAGLVEAGPGTAGVIDPGYNGRRNPPAARFVFP